MYDAKDLIGKESVLYKLTDKDGYTRRYETNQTLWMVGLSRSIDPIYNDSNELCSPAVFHAYLDPYLALMFNHLHAGFSQTHMRMFKVKGVIAAVDGIEKVGAKHLDVLEELAVPTLLMKLRREIAFNTLAKIPDLPENLVSIVNSRYATKDEDIDLLSTKIDKPINLQSLFYRAYQSAFLQLDLGILLKSVNRLYKVDVIDIIHKTIAAQSGQ